MISADSLQNDKEEKNDNAKYYIYIYIYMHVCIHIYMYVYICMYMNICVNICYHHDSGTGGTSMGFIHVSHMFCIALCVCGDVSVTVRQCSEAFWEDQV